LRIMRLKDILLLLLFNTARAAEHGGAAAAGTPAAAAAHQGSGTRASSVNSGPLMMSPLYEGSDTPFFSSRSADLKQQTRGAGRHAGADSQFATMTTRHCTNMALLWFCGSKSCTRALSECLAYQIASHCRNAHGP
jgi:hypothetical protein